MAHYTMTKALALRIADRIAKGSAHVTTYDDVIKAMSSESVARPGAALSDLIVVLASEGMHGMVRSIALATAREAYYRNRERGALIGGLRPFIDTIVEDFIEDMNDDE